MVRKAIDIYASALAILGTGFASILMLAISAEVVSRTVTGRSLPGMVDLSESALVAIVFFGIAYALRSKSHVRMTLVTDRVSGRTRFVLRLCAAAVVLIVVVWMTYATGVRAHRAYVTGEFRFGLLRWPLWPARFAVAFGLASTVPVAMYDVVEWGRAAVTGREPSSPQVAEPDVLL